MDAYEQSKHNGETTYAKIYCGGCETDVEGSGAGPYIDKDQVVYFRCWKCGQVCVAGAIEDDPFLKNGGNHD